MAISRSVSTQGGAQNPANFVTNVTEQDLSSYMPVQGGGGLNLQFEWFQVEVKSPDPRLNGTVETRLKVLKQPKADRLTIATEVLTPEQAAQKYPAEYAQFAEYNEVPSGGTPLAELPGMAESQIKKLNLYGINCIEDLVDVTEEQLSPIGLGAVKARKLAEAWLNRAESEKAAIDAAEREAKYDAERKAMEDRIKRLEEANMRLQVQAEQTSSRPAQAQVAAPQGQMGQAGVQSAAPAENLPYDLSEMSNPFDDGPSEVDGTEEMMNRDDDPLAELG